MYVSFSAFFAFAVCISAAPVSKLDVKVSGPSKLDLHPHAEDDWL